MTGFERIDWNNFQLHNSDRDINDNWQDFVQTMDYILALPPGVTQPDVQMQPPAPVDEEPTV
jgi:hypothetical protein